MKMIATVLLMMISFAAFSQTEAEKEIIDFMRTEESIWNAGDIEGYVNYIHLTIHAECLQKMAL
jgi:hypothetical protein